MLRICRGTTKQQETVRVRVYRTPRSSARCLYLGLVHMPTNLIKLANVDCSLSIGDVTVKPSTVVRDLGVLLDSELTLKQHISKVASCCYYHIRRLHHVSRFVSRHIIMQLTSAFILSRLDYCNIILAGLPKSSISTLQRVHNAAARLVLGLGHATTSLMDCASYVGFRLRPVSGTSCVS